ncbi:MAG TPA: FliM/FliN family flagellar motor switch protein [Steroidobacteraceae bacterium]|jgi:type III secretion protein Q|nr:FliM/FliN family flagellar motor switch protein [Steroidobacteraceae bacterium]
MNAIVHNTADARTLTTHSIVLDAHAVAAVNAFLSSQSEQVSWQCWGREYRLLWQAPAERSYALVLRLKFAAHTAALALADLSVLDPLMMDAPFTHLPATIRGRVIQRLVAQALTEIRALTDCTQVLSIEWEASLAVQQWPCQCGFILRDVTRSLDASGILATQSPAGMQWLRETVASSIVPAPLRGDLPVPVELSLGCSQLTKNDLSHLDIGDVVWIADAHHSRRGIRARLSSADGRWAFVGHIQRNAFSLLERDTARIKTTAPYGGDFMEHEHRAGSIKIPITFDIGELSIALQDLERTRAGQVLELPQDLSTARVHLRAGGQLIATGELVCVGRKLGVRITDARALRDSKAGVAEHPLQV